MRLERLLPLVLLAALAPVGASAQDVLLLGERYGTRPPDGYFREMSRNPRAFGFVRGRSARLRAEALDPSRGGGAPTGSQIGAQLALGPRDGPVQGTFAIPVLLGLYADTPDPAPFAADSVQEAYFSGAAGTVSAYYEEVSGGRVTLVGAVRDWRRVALTAAEVTQGESALVSAPLGGGSIGNFVVQLVLAQTGVDWGAFDNDGPDGLPNSGDDDGFVDALAVIHPTRGAECGGSGQGNRIWSHKWNLTDALRGATVSTGTPSANGGFIRVDDYFVQGIVSCDQTRMNEIGVFTHETGHAFGLPDLYDTRSSGAHAGAGNWDLMATGSWGCDNQTPSRPCHMGAWSKAVLGWVEVAQVPDGQDQGVVTLAPVTSSGRVLRVDANDGSGEYFLLENRQRIGFDGTLRAEGLLVWQIDPDWVAARWPANAVNADAHMGVWLRQADGRDDLGRSSGGRGDAGDPFPGSSGRREFHGASNPAAVSFSGTPAGVTILGISLAGDDLSMRLSTRRTRVAVSAQGTSGSGPFFTVDGVVIEPSTPSFGVVPFVPTVVAAAAGEELAPGIRTPFDRWAVDGAGDPSRTLVAGLADTSLVAIYSGREVQLGVSLEGALPGDVPGSVVSLPPSPGLWFPEGSDITVEAVPRPGYGFLSWTGALAGRANPTSLTMSGPLSAGASFELAYRVPPASFDLVATQPVDLQLQTVSGTAPVAWSLLGGALPLGLRLTASGRITGEAIETGSYSSGVEARDATGLVAAGTLTLEVREPQIGVDRAASPFLLPSSALTPAEEAYLDRLGNGVGGYDLGDFRAWVLANPELPLSAQFRALAGGVGGTARGTVRGRALPAGSSAVDPPSGTTYPEQATEAGP